MNSALLLLIILILVPISQNAMENNTQKPYLELDLLLVESRYNQLSHDELTMSCDVLLDDNKDDVLLDESKNTHHAPDQSCFVSLPEELMTYLLLKFDLKEFFALRRTDTIRMTLCSKNIIQRFLLEKRYKDGLLKKLPVYFHDFPLENHAITLDLNMLLITAAHAGYTEDFRILLNTPHILNHILEGTRAYEILSTAVASEQVGIVKQLVSHKIIKEKFTPEELNVCGELCDDNKKIKKLIKKRTLKSATMHTIRSFFGIHY